MENLKQRYKLNEKLNKKKILYKNSKSTNSC